jgi:hypothetical protein
MRSHAKTRISVRAGQCHSAAAAQLIHRAGTAMRNQADPSQVSVLAVFEREEKARARATASSLTADENVWVRFDGQGRAFNNA